jgi:transcriptional regulator with XRE-family HTH domain
MDDRHPSVLIDAHISDQVRLIRRLRGVQRARLGEALGVSHQQIRKYETGESRISGGRLMVIARTLGVPVRAFYDGIEEGQGQAEPPAFPGLLDSLPEGPVPLEDIVAVARCVAQIDDPAVRRGLLVLAKAIAAKQAAANGTLSAPDDDEPSEEIAANEDGYPDAPAAMPLRAAGAYQEAAAVAA